MTFNIQGHTRWGRQTAATRAPGIVRTIRRVRPDVLALQEATPFLLDQILSACGRLHAIGATDPEFWTANPILFSHSRLRILEEGTLDVLGFPLAADLNGANIIPRRARWAYISDGVAHTGLRVVNFHLQWGSYRRARIVAAEDVLEQFDDAVLLGDFNDVPGSEVHATLIRGGLIDTAQGRDEGGTWRDAGRTTDKRYDWILVPKGMEIIRYEVVRPEGRSFSSDHLPVVADIRP